jgi:hypothetical protein
MPPNNLGRSFSIVTTWLPTVSVQARRVLKLRWVDGFQGLASTRTSSSILSSLLPVVPLLAKVAGLSPIKKCNSTGTDTSWFDTLSRNP